MQFKDVEVGVVPDEQGRPCAAVMVTVADGVEVTFLVHQSQGYEDAINVEIDGDFADAYPSLRIHLNDRLVVDTEVEAPPEIVER